MVLHSVFFYLKEDVEASLAEEMKKSILSDLAGIKTIVKIHAGAPLGVDRDVVDNDYDMSLHAFFSDRESLNEYLKNPIHLSFLERYKSSWDHFRVCDTYLE